ncbi:MAG TPA: hypothetical protein VK689_03685 [Armatimonadota bacterium]|nr:hypothetical protein [Armatimonadota bacterium]
MTRPIVVDIEVPETLNDFDFPASLDERLQELLDKQDQEGSLAPDERREAEYLVELSNTLLVLRGRLELARRERRDAA